MLFFSPFEQHQRDVETLAVTLILCDLQVDFSDTLYGLMISAVSTAWKKCVAIPSLTVQIWVALALNTLPVSFQVPV